MRHAWLIAALIAASGGVGFADPPEKKLSPEEIERLLPAAAQTKIDFARDVEPIFQTSCYQCHGPAKQKGGLRLDSKEAALKGGDSGAVILPGKSAESLLIQNVTRIEGATPMPPSGKPLEPEQIGLLRAWIDQGATWPETAAAKSPKDHWAFKPPVRPEPPEVADKNWPRNPIDRFILARLEKEGLHPSPEAERPTLIRRLYLDLLGLPPTPDEVDAFVADTSADAYEKLVDRLLASPHYGERWARRWLDAARYADTNGYEKDRERSIWPYRDWVINALNEDKPFDQFAVEQIAGDMIPNATRDQKIATGFHRNTMINEEGGIDVEQFRFESVVDRVKTTGTVFLGMTIGCAQCHDHKYDPISQKEYYRIFSFLNNADEPELDVPNEAQVAERKKIEAKVAELESKLESQFPPYQEEMIWEPLEPIKYSSEGGALLTKREDKSLLAFGHRPEKDVYRIEAATPVREIAALRIEVLTDGRLPKNGPGRADHGNFVLSEFKVESAGKPIEFATAEADFSQEGFPVANAIDGDPKTGWAIATAGGNLNQNRVATFKLREALKSDAVQQLAITLEQNFGGSHTIGRFRISAGKLVRSHYRPELPEEEQRRIHLGEKYKEWEKSAAEKSAHWTVLDPDKFASEFGATMRELEDHSILVSGDKPNKDIYDIEFKTALAKITGLRMEVLPDPSLPDGGPGRGTVIGRGNFMLSEFIGRAMSEDDKSSSAIELQNPTADYAQGGRAPEQTIDGSKETGWAIDGGQGKPHQIVYQLKTPLEGEKAARLAISLVQYFIHQDTIGRFRISATSDEKPARAAGVPAEIEETVLLPAEFRSAERQSALKKYFLSIAPDLAPQLKTIAELRKSIPKFPATLVMEEREAPRHTQIHHRGEFLSPREEVEPGVPAILHSLPGGAAPNRLTFAKWLVDDRNPLLARVTVNRMWDAFFGRGLVPTPDDFGMMGEPPSHPELLDWLACEFMHPAQFEKAWSVKSMHRLIVTSAAYRQSSRLTPELREHDPINVLIARGPRMRVEAEVIRDIALSVSGLLNPKIGGPSVYPPQPPGVTELAYGSPAWNVSRGDDKYRRGLYTFFKRATPYPGFITFDAPTAEITCTRRMRSNTPLQALTTLNDPVFVEAAQAMARRVVTEIPSGAEARARMAFRLCLARDPEPAEIAKLVEFHEKQLARIQNAELDAAKLALPESAKPPENLDIKELAAWTAVSRALLNLDETMTKE